MEEDGLYCSTAGAYFHDKDALADHYKSDFHRYNLKRKIAGLPPVTREWYEARKSQLLASSAAAAVQRVWFDPLTRKKFYSENTYLAFTRSKKYGELVKKSGQPAPTAVVTLRQVGGGEAEAAAPAAPAPSSAPAPRPAKPAATMKGAIKVAGGVREVEQAADTTASSVAGRGGGEEEGAEGEEGSDWETASEEEMESDQQWEEWDVRRSLLDGHVSASMAENLEYMWKRYGLYLPDAEHLADPEGMLKYLGARLAYGHVPLYARGDDPGAKAFPSLHAVQRHMVDTNQCKVLYDGNEEEYEDFYDYGDDEGGQGGDAEMGGEGGGVLTVGGDDGAGGAAAAFELALPRPAGGVRILGSREFARYYRQRHRAGDERASTARATMLAQYRKLAVPLLEFGSTPGEAEQKSAQRSRRRQERLALNQGMRRNINDNLPKNVPY